MNVYALLIDFKQECLAQSIRKSNRQSQLTKIRNKSIDVSQIDVDQLSQQIKCKLNLDGSDRNDHQQTSLLQSIDIFDKTIANGPQMVAKQQVVRFVKKYLNKQKYEKIIEQLNKESQS